MTCKYLWPFITLVGCGGADGNSSSPDAKNESGLACNTVALCTSWWNVGTQVVALPAASGGTIASGTYILNDVLAVETAFDATLRAVMMIDGTSFLTTVNSIADGSGTIATSGNKITFTEERSCGYRGQDFGPSTRDPETFEYAVDGDALIVFDSESYFFQNQPIRVGLVFTRQTGDLCNPSGAATCTINACFCQTTTNGELSEAQCGGD